MARLPAFDAWSVAPKAGESSVRAQAAGETLKSASGSTARGLEESEPQAPTAARPAARPFRLLPRSARRRARGAKALAAAPGEGGL